jgi:hypothetical protein
MSIFMTPARVAGHDMGEIIRTGHIPPGLLPHDNCLVVSLKQTQETWRNDSDFRFRLKKYGPAWVFELGLKTHGIHEIDDYGWSREISYRTDQVPLSVKKNPEKFSVHSPCSGPVAAGVTMEAKLEAPLLVLGDAKAVINLNYGYQSLKRAAGAQGLPMLYIDRNTIMDPEAVIWEAISIKSSALAQHERDPYLVAARKHFSQG